MQPRRSCSTAKWRRLPGGSASSTGTCPMRWSTISRNGGLIFSHLATFYASAFPERLRALHVPGAERFGQDIAIVRTTRSHALGASFERFFMEVAPTAYPEGGFAVLGSAFGTPIDL